MLVDAGPDLRADAGRRGRLADAVASPMPMPTTSTVIDDLRAFVLNRRRLVDVWMDETTEAGSRRLRLLLPDPAGLAYPPIVTEHA